MKKETVNLFYIGDDFYGNSGTMMSSIYTTIDRNRYNWGKVKIALDNGKKIHIRPATEKEMVWGNNTLKEIKNYYGKE
jgi:hypothetical protein